MSSRRRIAKTFGLAGLTPLIDTVFLLLFALLAIADVKRERSVELVRVELPDVEPAETGGGAPALSIALEIDAEGRVILEDGRPIGSREELDDALAGHLGTALPEEATIEIRADRDSPYGAAAALLQHLRLGGFVQIRLIAVGREEHDPFEEQR